MILLSQSLQSNSRKLLLHPYPDHGTFLSSPILVKARGMQAIRRQNIILAYCTWLYQHDQRGTKHWVQNKKNNGKFKNAKHVLFFQGLFTGKRKFADNLLLDVNPSIKCSFRNRIQGASLPILACCHCYKTGHSSNDCWSWPENQCNNCGIFNHQTKDCQKPGGGNYKGYRKTKNKKPNKRGVKALAILGFILYQASL